MDKYQAIEYFVGAHDADEVKKHYEIASDKPEWEIAIQTHPQHDGGRHQVEAAGPVALLLETAIADFTQAVEEHGTGQRSGAFAALAGRLASVRT